MEQVQIDRFRFNIVQQHRRMLALRGFYLTRESRLLDFGCGTGENVYLYRDAGLDAYGFEIRNSVHLRRPEDECYFRYALTGKPADVPEYHITPDAYTIPFDDSSFDFVYSTETLDHVFHLDRAFAEMARVLRPGGVALHTFPGRLSLIEPHIRVPLGSVIRSYSWYLFWAYLGVRNEFQRGLGPTDRARRNWHYARTGVNWVRNRMIMAAARKHFSQVQLVPALWEVGHDGALTWRGILATKSRWFARLYSQCRTVVLWLCK